MFFHWQCILCALPKLLVQNTFSYCIPICVSAEFSYCIPICVSAEFSYCIPICVFGQPSFVFRPDYSLYAFTEATVNTSSTHSTWKSDIRRKTEADIVLRYPPPPPVVVVAVVRRCRHDDSHLLISVVMFRVRGGTRLAGFLWRGANCTFGERGRNPDLQRSVSLWRTPTSPRCSRAVLIFSETSVSSPS